MAASTSGPTVLDMVTDYLTGVTLRAMLTDGTFAYDKHAHGFRSAVTGEVSGAGYTAGGVVVTGVATQQDTTNSRVEIVADDTSFGTLTVAGIAGLVVYIDTGNAATDRILGVHTFAAESPSGENFTYAWNDDDAAPGTKGVLGYFTY